MRSHGKYISLLGSLCLFLSAVEYMIPKPLPFMRIGFANLPIMLALDILPFPSFIVLVFIKIFGQALITGTLFSYVFLFSLSGTFFSAILMYGFRRLFKGNISFAGIGTLGGMVSCISQLALARFFIFHESTRYVAPLFLGTSLVSGIALGVFCSLFIIRSRWYKEINSINIINRQSFISCEINNNKIFSANALFITGLLIIPSVVFNPSTESRAIQFLFFWFLTFLCGKKTNVWLTLSTTALIIAVNLLIPYGRVLLSIGPLRITSGALQAGIHRAVTFQALIMLSKLSISEELKLSGEFGKILSESLRIFSEITGRGYKLKGKGIIEKIDNLLLEASAFNFSAPAFTVNKTKGSGFFILSAVILISWLLMLFK